MMLAYNPDSPFYAARREHAFRLRQEGLTLRAIGGRLGISATQARNLLWKYQRKKEEGGTKPQFYWIGYGINRTNEAAAINFIHKMEKCHRGTYGVIAKALAKYKRLLSERGAVIEQIIQDAEKHGIAREDLERLWRNHRQNERLRAKKRATADTTADPMSGHWVEQ